MEKEIVKGLFDRIAGHYDLLNGILSLGVFNLWHNRLIRESGCPKNGTVVDFCSGTGEVLIRSFKKLKISRGVGVDISEEMLSVARRKTERLGLADRISFFCRPAEDPGIEGEFDCATIAFALRNVSDIETVFKQMARVVKKRGKAAALELTMPDNRFLRSLYRIYLGKILPVIGGLVTGNKEAYSYLARSIMDFAPAGVISEYMDKAGLVNIKVMPLSFGIARIFVGDKNE